MRASGVAFPELRDEPRRGTDIPAAMEARDAALPQEGSVRIEEVSASGVRLTSERQLHPDQALLLRLPGHVLPLHATVVWVEEHPPAHWWGHKFWLAGCRFRADSMIEARSALQPLLGPRPVAPSARSLWFVLGAAGVVGLLVYLYLTFARLMGGG
jgi:hypothetical protein